MTAAEPRERHPASRPQAEASDRLLGVIRAGRQMPAVKPGQQRKPVAIEFDQSPREEAWSARKMAQKRAQMTSLDHKSPRPALSLYPLNIVGAGQKVMPSAVKWEP